jgi:hypothetical protein
VTLKLAALNAPVTDILLATTPAEAFRFICDADPAVSVMKPVDSMKTFVDEKDAKLVAVPMLTVSVADKLAQ